MLLPRKGEVFEIRQRLLEQFGGLPGLRDEGLLDSALLAAANRQHYEAALQRFPRGPKNIAFELAVIFDADGVLINILRQVIERCAGRPAVPSATTAPN